MITKGHMVLELGFGVRDVGSFMKKMDVAWQERSRKGGLSNREG